jgi:hypothetical protein
VLIEYMLVHGDIFFSLLDEFAAPLHRTLALQLLELLGKLHLCRFRPTGAAACNRRLCSAKLGCGSACSVVHGAQMLVRWCRSLVKLSPMSPH